MRVVDPQASQLLHVVFSGQRGRLNGGGGGPLYHTLSDPLACGPLLRSDTLPVNKTWTGMRVVVPTGYTNSWPQMLFVLSDTQPARFNSERSRGSGRVGVCGSGGAPSYKPPSHTRVNARPQTL